MQQSPAAASEKFTTSNDEATSKHENSSTRSDEDYNPGNSCISQASTRTQPDRQSNLPAFQTPNLSPSYLTPNE